MSANSSTVTDTETDNDAGRRAAGGPRTDYQADPNTNIYTKNGLPDCFTDYQIRHVGNPSGLPESVLKINP